MTTTARDPDGWEDIQPETEPVLTSPLEWGGLFALLYLYVDFYATGFLSERGEVVYLWCGWLGQLLLLYLAAKEVRDRKRAGRAGFWLLFASAFGTGIAFTVAYLGLSMIAFGVDPGDTIGSTLGWGVASMSVLYAPAAAVLALVMRRRAGR